MRERIPKVTVLMPVYNAEKYLDEAISSILKQTFTDFEFLIIDDGSIDRSVKIIKSYDDSRIRLECNKKNLGLITTLNNGLELVRGKYVARMDNDDISLPERLAKQVAFLEKHPKVGVCGSWISFFGMCQQECYRLPVDYKTIKATLFFNNCVGHPNVMMRMSALNKYGLRYDPAHLYAEDYGLWVKCSFLFPIVNIPEVLLNKRIVETCICLTYEEKQKETVLQINKSNLERLGIKDIDEIDWAIHRHISFNDSDFFDYDLLIRANAWLKRLKAANEVRRCYPEPQFSELLNKKFQEINLKV